MMVWGVGGVVLVSEYMGGIRHSGVVSTTDDVLELSGVRVVRGVSEGCEINMYLARDGVGGVGGSIRFGLYQSCRNKGSVGHVSVFGYCWEEWVVGLVKDLGGVVTSMCVVSLEYLCRWQV